ncbi:MAG: hypothetical protein OCD01_06925 [Fibrobacterales bacterium]
MGILEIVFGLVIIGVLLLFMKEFTLPSSFYKRKDTRRVQNYIDQREKLMVEELDVDAADEDEDGADSKNR